MQLNASRIKVLQAQDDLVNEMKDEAVKSLLKVGKGHHHLLEFLNVGHHENFYQHLIKELIVQSLLRLKEPAVLLRCRKEDKHYVDEVLESARREYAEKAKVAPPEILVDENVHLPPGPEHHHSHGLFCSGGVVLASKDGKIVFENTLDARLEVVFRKKLPEIRKLLCVQIAA
jgi:V-type H+-transporting ATPase subunit E